MQFSKKAMEMKMVGLLILGLLLLFVSLYFLFTFLGPKLSVVWEKIASVLTGG
jgi:hypothetical protein